MTCPLLFANNWVSQFGRLRNKSNQVYPLFDEKVLLQSTRFMLDGYINRYPVQFAHRIILVYKIIRIRQSIPMH